MLVATDLVPRYVPVLTGKLGELVALQHLNERQRSRVTPCIDVPPIPRAHPKSDKGPPTPEVVLTKLLRGIGESLGRGPTFMLDLDGFEGYRPRGEHPITYAVSRAIDSGLAVSPVISNWSSSEARAAAKALQADVQERTVRIHIPDAAATDAGEVARALAEDLGVVTRAAHLLLDFGRLDDLGDVYRDEVAAALESLGDTPWRSATVVATALPDLSTLRSATRTREWREEWAFWRELNAKGGAGLVGYGDYGITGPRPMTDDPAYQPAPHLRYTLDEDYLLWKGLKADPGEGGAIRTGGTFPDLCRELMRKTKYPRGRAFAGVQFSWGDRRIAEAARVIGAEGAGGPSEWIRFTTNHHVAKVAAQMDAVL